MTDDTVARIDATADVGVEITDALGYDAREDVEVYVSRPELSPLSSNERHSTLTVRGEDAEVGIELDGEALDGLLDALYHVQQVHREEGREGPE